MISESSDNLEAAATLADDISFVLMLASRHSRTDPKELARVRGAFLGAIHNDDPAALEQLLTDDVVFTSDGGGKVPAAIVPMIGRERVSKFLFGLKEKQGWRNVIRMDTVMLNGLPGLVTSRRLALKTRQRWKSSMDALRRSM